MLVINGLRYCPLSSLDTRSLRSCAETFGVSGSALASSPRVPFWVSSSRISTSFLPCAARSFLRVDCDSTFRYCCRGRAEKAEQKNLKYALISEVLRDGGIRIATTVRFSAIPGHGASINAWYTHPHADLHRSQWPLPSLPPPVYVSGPFSLPRSCPSRSNSPAYILESRHTAKAEVCVPSIPVRRVTDCVR